MSSHRLPLQDLQHICAWQQEVLMPKDFNIPIVQKKNQIVPHPKLSIALMKTKVNHYNLQNMHPMQLCNALNLPLTEQPKFNISNINKLKRKMKILEQNNDRWQQPNLNNDIKYQKKRIMSGFIKPNVQHFHQESKQSSSMRILSKSTQHYQQKKRMQRPFTGVSRIHANMANSVGQFTFERSKTIHDKSSRPSTRQKIGRSNFIHKSINININQLQSMKMKKILKYLNKNK